jgi:hypothetical protein
MRKYAFLVIFLALSPLVSQASWKDDIQTTWHNFTHKAGNYWTDVKKDTAYYWDKAKHKIGDVSYAIGNWFESKKDEDKAPLEVAHNPEKAPIIIEEVLPAPMPRSISDSQI